MLIQVDLWQVNLKNPIFSLLLLAGIWGSSFILMKRGLFATDGSGILLPLDIAAIRITTASLLLLPVAIKALPFLKGKDYFFISVVGFAGSAIPALCFATAQQKIDSGVAGMLNSLTPFFTFAIGVLIFSQSIRRAQLAGISIAMAGTFILLSGGSKMDYSQWAFGGLLIVATFLYGLSVNTISHKLKHVPPLSITSVSLLLAAIPYSVYLLCCDFTVRVINHPEGFDALGCILILGGVGTGLANFIYFRLTQTAGPLYASSVTYLVPIVAFIWAFADGESMSVLQFIAACLIVCGVWLLRRK